MSAGAAENGDQPASTLYQECNAYLRVKCFIENTWPRSKRVTLCSLSEAVGKASRCALCQFLVDISELVQSTYTAGMPTEEVFVNDELRLVQGSSEWSWPNIAGCVLNVQVSPFAWFELGACPRIGVEKARYVCVAMEPKAETAPNQVETEVCTPRVRSLYEQTTGLVDFKLVKSWVEICTTFHGPECGRLHHTDPDSASTTPTHLIDLKTRKIATAQPGTRYVAVGYVWGEDAPANSGNSFPPSDDDRQLLTVDADSQVQLPPRLPQTLEDVLTLVDAIGERFVWIDKYCIDQKNEKEVEEQIANMDSIYRQAWLTVVALVSDGINTGFAGFSRPMRNRMQPTLALPQGTLTATCIEFTREYYGSFPWDKRAWTLQEFVLSRRCLIFSDHHVSMKCQEEFFHDVLPITPSPHQIQSRLDQESWWENVYAVNLDEDQWDFKTFDGLICIYSGRDLRYESDVLRACQDTLNNITRKTGIEFTFGLPVTDLHRALLWKPHNEVCLERRVWYDEKSRSWACFPSWTWAGWKGRTECDYWIGDMAGYADQEPSHEIGILNRKGRKRPRIDGSDSHQRSNPRQALISSYPTMDEVNTSPLKIFSLVAACSMQCIRKHNKAYQVSKHGAKRELVSIGDHWTLLEPDTGYKMRDIAGNEESFEKRDYFFRTDATTSGKMMQADCRAELLMISLWPLIRDSEQSNTWLQDMVSCLIILRNDDGTAWRLAAILLEEEAWKRCNPAPAEVNIV